MSGQPNQGKFVKVKVNLNSAKNKTVEADTPKNLQKTTKKITASDNEKEKNTQERKILCIRCQ